VGRPALGAARDGCPLLLIAHDVQNVRRPVARLTGDSGIRA
jgi:hypothetical protein